MKSRISLSHRFRERASLLTTLSFSQRAIDPKKRRRSLPSRHWRNHITLLLNSWDILTFIFWTRLDRILRKSSETNWIILLLSSLLRLPQELSSWLQSIFKARVLGSSFARTSCSSSVRMRRVLKFLTMICSFNLLSKFWTCRSKKMK